MSRSLTRWQQLFLGLTVLVGLGLGGFGVYSVGSRHWLWGDTFHVRVGFPQVHGVEPGTRVRVKGKDAGEVERVDWPDLPSGQVMLTLRLDGRVRSWVRADAVAQIVSEGMVGGKVVEIFPGTDGAAPVRDNAVIASRPTTELGDVLGQLGKTLDAIENGQGSVGKLVKEEEAYKELVGLLKQGRRTMASLNEDAEAIKGMPLVRNYVQDTYKELVRPDCERNRQWFPADDLFEPGRAVLTTQGREHLNALAPWLLGLKHTGSEVVVASYAQQGQDPDAARVLTQKQSEAVCDYLVNEYAVQKMGWFTRRKVTALGLGVDEPPVPVKELRPGVEVLVFVPQH